MTMRTHAVALVLAAACWTGADASETSISEYRGFALGDDVAAVAALAGAAPSEARTIHQRPALVQELEWRPSRWVTGSMSFSTDPVDRVVFSFYNGHLFSIAVAYSPNRTKGMTSADMIDAVSAIYGAPGPGAARTASPAEAEFGTAIARWGDSVRGAVLYQTSSYRSEFRLVLSEASRAALAREAGAAALRLDEREAPRREAERQAQERDDARAAEDKARLTNKAAFRP